MARCMTVKIPSGFTLMEGERPYWYGKPCWKAGWPLILLGLLTIWCGLGIIFFIIAFLRVKNTEYLITSHRRRMKYGILSRRIIEIKNEWVTGSMIRQGFISKKLNYGDLVLSTPGRYAGFIAMFGVSDPIHVKTIAEDALRRFKEIMKIQEDLRELEKELELGRVPKEKYEELKKY
jgi:uncharacterized membrane protein YdbT with pleckstrin-like domain